MYRFLKWPGCNQMCSGKTVGSRVVEGYLQGSWGIRIRRDLRFPKIKVSQSHSKQFNTVVLSDRLSKRNSGALLEKIDVFCSDTRKQGDVELGIRKRGQTQH